MSGTYELLVRGASVVLPGRVVRADIAASGGRIVKSGDRSLALELERRGYDWVLESRVA